MGRTCPTYREKISDWEDDYRNYRRALRHRWQQAFDEVTEHIRMHSMAGDARNHHTPELAHFVSVCVGQQQKIRELRERVKELEREN